MKSAQREPLKERLHRAERGCRRWSNRRNVLYHEVAAAGNFREENVVVGFKKMSGLPESRRIRSMKKLGMQDRVIFFYDPEENAFYSADSTRPRWVPDGVKRGYRSAVLLSESDFAWNLLIELMRSKRMRKLIKEIAGH